MQRAIATSPPHPEDRDANIVVLKFHDEEMADESYDCNGSKLNESEVVGC